MALTRAEEARGHETRDPVVTLIVELPEPTHDADSAPSWTPLTRKMISVRVSSSAGRMGVTNLDSLSSGKPTECERSRTRRSAGLIRVPQNVQPLAI